LLLIKHKNVSSEHLIIDRNEVFIAAVLLAVVLLRLIPFFFQAVPSGAEMSIEAFNARIIAENDGLARTFSSGLAILIAIISLLGKYQIFRSALLVTCLSYGLLTLAYYVLFLRFMKKYPALISSLAVTFLTWSPQYLIGIGSNGIVLSTVFLIIAISLILEQKGTFKLDLSALSFLAFTASMLTFPIFLYPGHILFLLIPFLLIFMITLLMKIMHNKIIVIILIAIGLTFYCTFYLINSINKCPVVSTDLSAFDWIDTTISKNSIFLCNQGDAGIWIPAIIDRKIINTEDRSALKIKSGAQYIYIGSKIVGKVEYRSEELERFSDRYKIIYNKNGSQVWKIF
jgi:hypothetical protein